MIPAGTGRVTAGLTPTPRRESPIGDEHDDGRHCARGGSRIIWRGRRNRRALADAAVLAPPAGGQGRDGRCGFIVLLILVAIFAPLIVKLVGAHPPNQQNPTALDAFGTADGPDRRRTSSASTSSAATCSPRRSTARACRSRWRSSRPAISVIIGVTVGLVAGFFRGWVDTIALAPDRRAARVPDPAAGASAWRRPARSATAASAA